MKKYKLLTLILSTAALGLFIGGCTSTNTNEKIEATVSPQTEINIPPTENLSQLNSYEEAGKQMIPSIIKGLSDDNYAIYSRDFDAKNKEYFNKELFQEAAKAVKDKLGDFEEITYVGTWTKGNYHIAMWKAKYTKSEDDIIMQMYIAKEDGTYKIAAFKIM